MAGNNQRALPRLAGPLLAALACGALLWLFPPFRIVSSGHTPGVRGGRSAGDAFDAAAAAAKVWTTDFRAAADRAADLATVVAAIQQDPAAARTRHARAAGLGTVYYFVRGTGRVVAREGSRLRLAPAGAPELLVELRFGPVFGNTVRDGSGLFEVNNFPGLQEFNALASELNALVEKDILPVLREKALVGSEIVFAGCAEAPETSAGPAEPVLILIPVQAEVR